MRVLAIAHRGASLDAPENTLGAFSLAREQGADMIETDLHLTRDRAIVLCHEATLAGEPLRALALERIRELRLTIPTLDQALDSLPDLPFNLEIKRPPDGPYPGLERRAVEEVRRRRRMAGTVFSCFDPAVLERVREQAPEARLALLADTCAGIEPIARILRIEAIHLSRRAAGPGRIAALQSRGWRVRVFTVDDVRDQRRLVGWGVNGIFTNAPARLRALLDFPGGPTLARAASSALR